MNRYRLTYYIDGHPAKRRRIVEADSIDNAKKALQYYCKNIDKIVNIEEFQSNNI